MATPNGKGGWELSDDDINEMRAAGMIDDTPSELQQYGIVYAQGLARLRKKDDGGYVLASEAAEHEKAAVAAARVDAMLRISVLLTVELERIAAKTGVPVRSCLIDVGTVLDLIDDVGDSDG
jgi:hypothetical protein